MHRREVARRMYQRLIAPGGIDELRRELTVVFTAIDIVEKSKRTNRGVDDIIDDIAAAIERREEEGSLGDHSHS